MTETRQDPPEPRTDEPVDLVGAVVREMDEVTGTVVTVGGDPATLRRLRSRVPALV